MSRKTLFWRAGIAVATTSAALLLGACGADGATAGTAGTDANGMNAMPSMSQGPSTAAKSWNDADVQFAQAMIPDHQMVAKMAALAATKANNAQLKTLAAQMKKGQTAAVDKLTGWLKAWGKPVAGDMAGMTMPGAMTDKDMTKLKSAKGMAFDMMFAQMMIAHHNGALQMARAETANGLNVDAKAMADAMIKTQTAQITALQKFASM